MDGSDNALKIGYYILLDILGVSSLAGTPTLLHTWWYLGLSITVIVLFPIIFKLYNKFGWIVVPAWFFLFCSLQLSVSDFTDWLILVPIGILFANRDLLEKCREWKPCQKRAASAVVKFVLFTGLLLLLLLLYIQLDMDNTAYGAKLAGNLLSLSVVLWVWLFLDGLPIVAPVLAFFGRHSMNIFLFHNFLRKRWMTDQLYSLHYVPVIVFALLMVSTLISIGINALKKYSGYDRLVQRIHQRLGA